MANAGTITDADIATFKRLLAEDILPYVIGCEGSPNAKALLKHPDFIATPITADGRNGITYHFTLKPSDATWLVPYDDIKSSYKLAMETWGINPTIIEQILTTVDDYAANHYGDN